MKQLYICRGIPGSGKTTYARTLAPLVIEPDMFRYNENNEYVFDSDKNADVIAKTKSLCEYAMRGLQLPCLAVTATFVKIDHFLHYIRRAKKNGYAVTVIECTDQYENVHQVPDKVIARMKAEWEVFDEELANQEGVSLWRIEHGEKVELYTPKGHAAGREKTLGEKLSVCTPGASCFYYGGIATNPEIPNNVGRHLCFCVNGRYDSGANAKYIDELKKCPCGKW